MAIKRHPPRVEAEAVNPTPPAAPMRSPLEGKTILLADTNAREITALQTVLGEEGCRVEIVTEATYLLEEAKRLSPAVILIDTTLPGLDVGKLTRVFARNPSTAGSAVALLVPADATSRATRQLRELDTFSLLLRPLTCAAIRETCRNAALFAEESARTRKSQEGGRGSNRHVAGCNALLRRELTCPFHSFGVKVNYYQLRAGKVYADTDLFDIPLYRQAARDGDFVDYNLAGLAICPDCFFATNDPNYFEDPATPATPTNPAATTEYGGNRNAYRIDPATRGKIAKTSGFRAMTVHDRLGDSAKSSFFSYSRSPEEALVAYELAIASSKALHEVAPVRRSIELLRIGNYELRRALILNANGYPTADVRHHRRSAIDWLARVFEECKGVAMYKAAYQLLALQVYLDDDKAAFPYLNALKEQSRLSRRDQEDPAMLERYLRRAETVWRDRDDYRANSAPGAPGRSAA